MESGFELELDPPRIWVSGELSAEQVAALAGRLGSRDIVATCVDLDLSELDLVDGAAILAFVELIRRLAARTEQLIVHGAPQLLAHTLYRADRLERVRLSEPREEEPYG